MAGKLSAEGVDFDIDGLPGRMLASCVSLKLAVTQMSSGTITMIDCPGAASAPIAAVSLMTRPSTVARSSVRRKIGDGAIELRLGLLELRAPRRSSAH